MGRGSRGGRPLRLGSTGSSSGATRAHCTSVGTTGGGAEAGGGGASHRPPPAAGAGGGGGGCPRAPGDVYHGRTARIAFEIMAALCHALDATPGELFGYAPAAAPPE